VTPDNSTPVIESISPTAVYLGSSITITGKNFGNTQLGSIVELNGITPAATDYYSWSSTQIKVKVPVTVTPGKLYVTVGGKKSNGFDFMVKVLESSSPQITALTLLIGQPGQTLKLVGKNFGATQGNSYVEFNGTKVTQYGTWSDIQISVTVPSGATSGDVIAYINGVPTNGKYFTIQSAFKLLDMVLVPNGTFQMGNPNSTNIEDNYPVHTVIISHDFYMSKTEITQKQWGTILTGSNPSKDEYLGDNKPVEQVEFWRTCKFCNELSKQEGFKLCYVIDEANGSVTSCDWTANGYRLPTEAEWEYACRANHIGDYSDQEILDMAWTAGNSGDSIHDVGLKLPNAFGLYDMIGNVAEWCWDLYEYYSADTQTDPHGPLQSDGELRNGRGGSFISGNTICNITKRETFPSAVGNYNFNLGFRVVRLK